MGYLDDDCGPNGLQVPGSEQIQTVVPGDSANADLFAREPDQPDGPFVRSQRPFTQIKLRLSETRAIRSERFKQAGGTQLRWPFT